MKFAEQMELPVGYHPFHANKFINYQLNRWYSLGYARREDIEQAARGIRSFEDHVQEFAKAAERAKGENRLKHAATYLRASEFLIAPEDERKIPTYKAFIALFDEAFKDEPFERHAVPYQGSYLSAIKVRSKTAGTKGTIVACGGFDSFIEEFYCMWDYFAAQGYDVVAFEGPGQGGSLRLHGQLFDHDWEKPTSAVLDHFQLQDVTALGLSMGGYWILRAAAYEKRIKRVIAMPPVYDWLELTSAFNRKLVGWLMQNRGLMNFLVRMKMNAKILRHAIGNTLFIAGKHEPVEAVQWMLAMNPEHLCSALVDQHVLLLGGEHDAFQPPVLIDRQRNALVNARSTTVRVFTKAEHADQHCQIGNVGLALETMLHWIQEKERG